MKTGEKTAFASASVLEHVLRGIVGFSAITGAVLLGGDTTLWWTLPAALGLVAIALVAFRGCPACWTIGLIETGTRIWSRRNSRY